MRNDRPSLHIRAATIRDLDAILAIENVSFATPWTRQAVSDELRRRRHAIYLAADSDEALIGYAGAWCYEGEAHIMNVAVAPDFRRQGVGEALLMELLSRAREAGADLAYLEVRPSNRGAIALYRKLGFTEAGRRPRYYRDTGEDAILMTLFDLQSALPSRLQPAWEAWEGRHGPRPATG